MKKRKKNIFRITQADLQAIEKLQLAAGEKEIQAFTLCSKAETKSETIYIANRVLIPDEKDAKEQSATSIAPTAGFQAIAYGLAYDWGLSVIDIHTHPFASQAKLSPTDFYYGRKNAHCIAENFPETSTMGMIVLDGSMKSFEGKIWDRQQSRFKTISQIEIVGSPINILPEPKETILKKDVFARHRIIPYWKQDLLGQLKVFVVGLGGNGSLISQALLCLGIGSQDGWLRACDPDKIEASNLSRIPYAVPSDVGRSKAEVTQEYAERKFPRANVRCYSKSIQDPEMLAIAKEAHVIIGAIDSDGARKVLNSLSARYLISYIDVSSEIIPEDSSCQSVGQVHAFVPGVTGCLMCCGAIDVNEAALDLLSDEQKAERAKAGYVRGTNETPTPSVLHLNGVASHLAISQFLRLVFGEDVNKSSFLHYERQKYQLIPAEASPDPNCPVCGTNGYMGEGDEVIIKVDFQDDDPKMFQMVKGEIACNAPKELAEA